MNSQCIEICIELRSQLGLYLMYALPDTVNSGNGGVRFERGFGNLFNSLEELCQEKKVMTLERCTNC